MLLALHDDEGAESLEAGDKSVQRLIQCFPSPMLRGLMTYKAKSNNCREKDRGQDEANRDLWRR